MKTGGSGNVASFGQLDINAMITYKANNIIEELMTARSDYHKIKRRLYSEIADTGELYDFTDEDRKLDKSGGTSNMKDIYIRCLGLATR